MKCFVLKSGEIVPASKVDGIQELPNKTIVKFTKYIVLAGISRKMVCYEEAVKFRKMTQEEEEEFGIK